MKNTFGQAVTLTLFGESHGAAVGAVLDGLAPGLPVDGDFLRRQLSRRRPTTALDTARQEPDNYQILSGVFQGRTTGTPLTIVIPNENTRSGDYTYGLARPSHADYAAYCKYHGYEDWRGGGHFSGRVTAPLVAAGAILLSALAGVGVTVGTHILRCGDAWDRPFADRAAADVAALQGADFPALTDEAAQAISSGDKVSVDFATGVITDETAGRTFQATAFPGFINKIIENGGLLPYLKARQDA